MCFVRKRRCGFAMLDLAMAIAVVGLGTAMLVPGLFRSRETARRIQCGNNLHVIGLALLHYEESNKTFPPGMICDKGEDPALTEVFRPDWVVLILPQLDERPLYESFGFAGPRANRDTPVAINDPGNRTPRGTLIPMMLCPSDAANNRKPFGGATKAEGDNWARGNYAVNAGNFFIGKDGGVTDANSRQWADNRRRGVMAVNNALLTLGDVVDGTSYTILAGDIRAGVTDKDRRGVWAMGMAGSSIACAHGSWGDANGPNACNRWADDIKGGDQVKIGPSVEDQCMEAWGKSGSRQATFRSLHRNGCNVAMVDCSVHFISDSIETSGPWGDAGTDFWPVWDRLICSADRHPIDGRMGETPARDARARQTTPVKVAGTAKFRDGTVPEGQYRFVTFHPDRVPTGDPEPAKGAGGEIKPDGRFELSTIKPGDGVLPGRYKVTVRCVKNYADPDSLTIPKKYAEVSTTPLEVTIDKGRSDLEFVLDK